ncbi:hypothetical protein D7B24_003227 [Verticillium nonalfalfae]|uniref:NADH:flavin oxidoreductase/NADH oxidase N-terminal domain-containing protein n=1 Tax=Verticillium nonalfalfae TaxID=1051616 RepID=A0A3M9YFF3_9PEZI|nr:uncharacterized protein D7B24_003227 [Verticillium nonalfalfae]RNJ59134.1 hypothetical protein D7B24_003227 [Verticillium nonalfalfae]
MGESKLFQPVTVGNMKLEQRLAMCPLTRFRATENHIPMPSFEQYYGQRASTPGTLLVSEGTFIAPEHGGYANVPGIYNEEQVEAWRKVTDAVHDKGSFIVCQLWALGRTASVDVSEKEEIMFRSSGNIAVDADRPAPAPLTLEEIKSTAQQYAQAAKNAMRAGFDAVELHGANGYLIDQFLQDTANNRTDTYGGSVDNRSRFALEMVQAVCDAVGPERTGIRFSPWSTFNAMKMKNPIPQFTDIIKKLNPLKLAYIHLVESRIAGNLDVEAADSLAFAVEAREGPLLIAGGYTPQTARRLVDEDFPDKDIVVGFGRFFISTPDLPFRIKTGLELNKYNRDTFYTPMSTVGYTDYPFSKEFINQSQGSLA